MEPDYFQKSVEILKDLLANDKAQIRFMINKNSLSIENNIEEELASKDIDKSTFDKNIEEILHIITLLTKKRESEKISIDNPELQYKVNVVNRLLPIEKFKKEYIFSKFSSANLINQLNFQPIIKPVPENDVKLVSGLINISFQKEGESQNDVMIEVNSCILDKMITNLTNFKDNLLQLEDELNNMTSRE